MGQFQTNGFTLIEVLVSMVILAIGLLALSSIQSNSARHNRTARDVSQGVFLVQEQLENCINAEYDDLEDLVNGLNGTTVGGYSVSMTVTENATMNTKFIQVEITNQRNQVDFNLLRSDCY